MSETPDLQKLAGKLRTQLHDLHLLSRVQVGEQDAVVDVRDTFDDEQAPGRVREIVVRLTPQGAAGLIEALDEHHEAALQRDTKDR